MQLIPFTVKKRNVTRTVMVPDHGDNSWRAFDGKPAHFRFESDTTTYKRGQLTIVFDLDGKPIEGWSYWTCIYCRSEPSEDFPQGRVIYNGSGYGSYTGKHIGELMWFFEHVGEQVTVQSKRYPRVYKVVSTHTYKDYEGNEHSYDKTRCTRAYTVEVTSEKEYLAHLTCAVQHSWGYGVQPSDMRERLRRQTLTQAQRDAEDRKAERARVKAAAASAARMAELERQWQAEQAAERSARGLTLVQGGVA